MREVLIFAILMVLYSSHSALPQDFVRIRGRVINEQGKPLAGAETFLDYESTCDTCIDQILVSMLTPSEGVFYLSTENIKNVQSVRLFVEQAVRKEVFKLIYDPALNLSHLPQYRGIEIDVTERRTVDVGDVAPTIRYKEFSFNASEYLSPTNNSIDAVFTVRDYDKRKIVARERRVSNTYLQPNGMLWFALPVGKWILEVRPRNEKNKDIVDSFLVDTTCDKVRILAEV